MPNYRKAQANKAIANYSYANVYFDYYQMDAILSQINQQKAYDMDLILKDIVTKGYLLDLYMTAATRTKNYLLDAYVEGVTTATRNYLLDLYLTKTRTRAYMLDLYLLKRFRRSITLEVGKRSMTLEKDKPSITAKWT